MFNHEKFRNLAHNHPVVFSQRIHSVEVCVAKWIRTPQVPGLRLGGYGKLSTEFLTDYHHNSIIKFSVRWCVYDRSGKDFPIESDPRH